VVKKRISVILLLRKQDFFVSRKAAKTERTNPNFQAQLICFSKSRIRNILGKVIAWGGGICWPRGYSGDCILFPRVKTLGQGLKL
jgi:hypothetical protein